MGCYRSNGKDVALICAHSQSSPVETLGATLCRKVTLADLILLVVRCISPGHNRWGLESLQLLTNWSCNNRSSSSQSNLWIKYFERQGHAFSLQSGWWNHSWLDLVQNNFIWTWSVCETPIQLKLQIVSGSALLKFQQVQFQYSPSLTLQTTSHSQSAREGHQHFRRSLSRVQTNQTHANTFQMQFGRHAKESCWINLVSL